MKERPIESLIPSEIMAKAREYAKTIDHSYADTREELEEDVALAWAKGFIFCLQGKVTAIYKENAELKESVTKFSKDGLDFLHSIKSNRNCIDCERKMSIQLIKAKEIIKSLCEMVRELNKPNVQLTNVDYSLSEAEQFLSEVEK